MQNHLAITLIAFDEIHVDRESGVPTGSKAGWRLKAVLNNTRILIEKECEDEREVRDLLYRIADNHIPKISPV